MVSEAEFIPDPRIRALPVTDAEIYTYAHVVYLKERQNARLVRAFLAVLRGLLDAQLAIQPPSTIRFSPVMKVASSEARKSAALATSSGAAEPRQRRAGWL